MLAVIPPRTTRRTGEDQADWSADLTSENDTRSHPMDGGEPTRNRLRAIPPSGLYQESCLVARSGASRHDGSAAMAAATSLVIEATE
jgi:hypothetical protein